MMTSPVQGNTENPEPCLMQSLTAHQIVFVLRAREAIQFSTQPGMNVRGALYQALITRFSPNNPIPDLPLDPIRQFLEGLDDESARGRDVPRSYAIEPPPADAYYRSGEQFEFGITLIGEAVSYIPYLFYAMRDVSHEGIGAGRGRFDLIRIGEVNPLNKSRCQIMDPHTVSDLRLAIKDENVQHAVRVWRGDQVLLRFMTPTRLTDTGALVHQPRMGVLLRRLLERAQSLVEQNQPADIAAGTRERWKAEWMRMGAIGDALDSAGAMTDLTRWIDVNSYSRIKGRSSPIGGFIGHARWRVADPDVLYWLLWGQCLHVGKNTAKGDGWYVVE